MTALPIADPESGEGGMQGESRSTESDPMLEKFSSVGASVLEVKDLVKTFESHDGGEVRAVDGVTLSVPPGKFVVLLGPSGCGKTSLLRCIAGLETPSSGQIEIGGRTMFSSSERVNVPVQARQTAMMFQTYALWPHMTVLQNISFPMRVRKIPKAKRAKQVDRLLTQVNLSGIAGRYPSELSGGQQQRVALARSLAVNQDVVLFDEPLSNVDAKVRETLRDQLLSLQREIGFAAVHVTHDQIEALDMADIVGVMNNGQLEQWDPPEEIYRRPQSAFVARFVGLANEIAVLVKRDSPKVVTVQAPIFGGDVTLDNDKLGDGRALAFLRPELLTIGASDNTSGDRSARGDWLLRGILKTTRFRGDHLQHIVDVGGETLLVHASTDVLMDAGSEVQVHCPPSAFRLYPDDRATEL